MEVGRRGALKTIEEQFSDKFIVTPGCWLWVGLRDKDGYGLIRKKHRGLRAHRISYELFVAPIPAGLIVRHKCDTPRCVNPEHLEVGTAWDNAQDKVLRNRDSSLRGEEHPRSVFSTDQIVQIRSDKRLQKFIAADYKTTVSTVSKIQRRALWAHV